MGRTKLIETPEKMWDLYCEYVKWAQSNPIKIEDYVGKDAIRVEREKPRAISIDGFECWCYDNQIIADLSQYFANTENRYTDYQTICSRIRRAVRVHQIEGGMAGIYNPSITQRLNNLVEKQEVKEITEVELSEDQLSAILDKYGINPGTPQ